MMTLDLAAIEARALTCKNTSPPYSELQWSSKTVLALCSRVRELEDRMRANETEKWIDVHAKVDAKLAVAVEALNRVLDVPKYGSRQAYKMFDYAHAALAAIAKEGGG